MNDSGPAAVLRHGAERIGQIRAWLLGVIAVLLSIAALKLSLPVTLPLTFAVFLIAVFWPVQERLEQRLPRGAAAVLVLLLFLLLVAVFAGALWWSGQMVVAKAPDYAEQFQRYREQVTGWAGQLGIELGQGGSLREWAVRLSQSLLAFIGGFVLVIAFFVLGLLEVHRYRAKLERIRGPLSSADWRGPVTRIVHDFQRYIVVRTAIGLITGALAWLIAWLMGLDFAFVWGLSTFLLNYIPTLGSIAAVLPPVLFALVQFESWAMALWVLLLQGGMQLIMGNYVDPLIQGKYLHLSPLVVLLAVVFWGWVWGIAGAFIAMPLVVALVITCDQFARTRWIAILLGGKAHQ